MGIVRVDGNEIGMVSFNRIEVGMVRVDERW